MIYIKALFVVAQLHVIPLEILRWCWDIKSVWQRITSDKALLLTKMY